MAAKTKFDPKKPLKRPLKVKELKERATKDGRLKVALMLDFTDLMKQGGDNEKLNDYADDAILGAAHNGGVGGSLLDVGFKILSANERTQKVVISVEADVSEILADIAEDEKAEAERKAEAKGKKKSGSTPAAATMAPPPAPSDEEE